MSTIYQRIWDADQQAAGGLPALRRGQPGDPATGYVVVDEDPDGGPDHRIFPDVVIPDAKRETYDLCRALFDNFTLDQRRPELADPQEDAEVHRLLEVVAVSAPMRLARQYIEQQTGEAHSAQRWYALLLEIWFRRYRLGNNPDLSGFEHVVVGEQKGSKLGGYHFWYKYWLDDGLWRALGDADAAAATLFDRDDTIVYHGTRYGNLTGQGVLVPEVVTLSYRWHAPDFEAGALRPLTKPIGGFWVGCSVEGLLALATVRFLRAALAPKETVINGARYDLKVYRSDDDRSVRTFYPVFLGPAPGAPAAAPVPAPGPAGVPVAAPAEGPRATPGAVRILAATVNPPGHDPGAETVTLINASPAALSVEGWRIVAENGSHYTLADVRLEAGEARRIVLPADTAQLTNRGGRIRLLDRAGEEADAVAYSRAEARRQGWTLVF